MIRLLPTFGAGAAYGRDGLDTNNVAFCLWVSRYISEHIPLVSGSKCTVRFRWTIPPWEYLFSLRYPNRFLLIYIPVYVRAQNAMWFVSFVLFSLCAICTIWTTLLKEGNMVSCIRKFQLCVFAEIDHLNREAMFLIPPPMYMNFRSSESEEL